MKKIIDEKKLDDNSVTAIIEVKVSPAAMFGYKNIAKTIAKYPEAESVYLMSGDYDLAVIVNCTNIKEVGRFVAERLSPIGGILNIATHFIIGRYKQSGEEFHVDDDDERGFVSP